MAGRRSDLPQRIMAFLEQEARRANRTPAIRDIGAAVGVRSTSVISYHLTRLEEQGLLTHTPGAAHAWQLARQPGIPILGTIAAGLPLTIYGPDHQETLDINLHLRGAAPNDHEFALLVQGDSMIEDHIFDGDYVLVHPGNDASNDAIVVAVHTLSDGTPGAATVKRLRRDKQRREVRLEPANAAMDPIIIPAAEWNRSWLIQGTVTAVYRPCFPTSRPARSA